jgi:hypothetical protein
VSVVIVISHLGIDQGVSRFTAGTVRGHYRIPVIVESGRPRAAALLADARRQPLVGGQSEIIIRTEVDELATIKNHARRLRPVPHS